MIRRSPILMLVFAAGCSTHPCVDVCDYFQPGRMYANKVTPYGGVCAPQAGAIQGTPPSVPLGMPLIPPPVPTFPQGPISIPNLPAPAPPGSIVPVPPTGGVPPPPAFPTAPR